MRGSQELGARGAGTLFLSTSPHSPNTRTVLFHPTPCPQRAIHHHGIIMVLSPLEHTCSVAGQEILKPQRVEPYWAYVLTLTLLEHFKW